MHAKPPERSMHICACASPFPSVFFNYNKMAAVVTDSDFLITELEPCNAVEVETFEQQELCNDETDTEIDTPQTHKVSCFNLNYLTETLFVHL